MGEYTFRIFRKLLCTTLILSLLWPDLAKCMDEEENLNHSFIPQSLLQNNTSDQKRGLQSIDQKESLPSIILKKKKTSSEDLRHEDNQENNSEKTNVSEEITNKDESSSTTNTSSHESKETEEKKEDEKNTETLSPQTTSLPKGNEPSKEIKKEKNNPLQESIKIFEEGEEGGFGEKTVNLIETVEEEEEHNLQVPLPIKEDEKLSEKTQSFLSYFKKRIIDGWPTWKQVVGAIGGAVIGVGVGVGMALILFGDFVTLPGFLENKVEFLFGSLKSMVIFLGVVGMTSSFDAIMRNSSTLLSIFDNAGQDFFLIPIKSYKKRLNGIKFGAYTNTLISSALPVSYVLLGMCWGLAFIFPSFYNNKTTSEVVLIWGALSVPQVLDTTLSYGKSLSDRAEKWVKKKALQKRLKTLSFASEEEKIETHQLYVDALKKLMWILYKLPGEQIKKLYEEIFQKKENGENSENLKALKTLEVLLKVYESYEGEDPVPSQQAKKKQASILGWIGMLLASPGRHVVFWSSITFMLNYFYFQFSTGANNPPPGLSWPLSVIFGGIIGATVQGYFEKENLGKSYFNITRGKTVTEPQCWWPIRIINKAWNYLIQGPFYSIPYAFALVQSLIPCNVDHECHYVVPLPLIIIMGIPFFLADAFNNATYFNESSGKWISAINRLLSYTPFARYLTGYKKDKLIEITHGFREKMRDLIPEVVKDLDTYFRKKIPTLFQSQTNEEDSEKEERYPFLKDEKEITFYDHKSIDNFNSTNSDIQFEMPKKNLLSTCWRGLGKCYQNIPSLSTCWKGVKKGFTFLFSSCRKRSKDRELNIFDTDDDNFEREKLIN